MTKFCKDCRWIQRGGSDIRHSQCLAPENMKVDPVSGDICSGASGFTYCALIRERVWPGDCKWFEQKEVLVLPTLDELNGLIGPGPDSKADVPRKWWRIFG